MLEKLRTGDRNWLNITGPLSSSSENSYGSWSLFLSSPCGMWDHGGKLVPIPLGKNKTSAKARAPREWAGITLVRYLQRQHPKVPSGTSIHLDVLSDYTPHLYVTRHILRRWDNQLVFWNENRWHVILHEQLPVFQDVICPWASGAHKSEVFLSYRSLKHGN